MKIDKEYLEAFNLGYELAKELNLKTRMFKDTDSGNNRLSAIEAGMAEFGKEINLQKNIVIVRPRGLVNDKKANKDKGFDLSI